MFQHVTISRLAKEIGRSIRKAFDEFQGEFRVVTQRARTRFFERDWEGIQADSALRLDVYEAVVGRIVARIRELGGDRVHSRLLWVSTKSVYSALIQERDDWEIAETFFNSVTRQIFTTVGVDPEIEFVLTDYDQPPTLARKPVYRTYEREAWSDDLMRAIFADAGLPCEAELCRQAVEMVKQELASADPQTQPAGQLESVEMTKSMFFRGEHAFLIGRMQTTAGQLPLVFCFCHPADGIHLDAVLTDVDEVSMLFSFARNYFLAEMERPYDLVRFIKSIIPAKPTAEIYISLGYNKHGKTELYRHALRHLKGTHDHYQLAEGQRGMVMLVFTMPSYPVVFKIIKDRFDFPKECTRQEVIDRYNLIFRHDRAGRLIDAQEYKYLVLDRARFSEELLEELLTVTSETVTVEKDKVVIRHCYAERRVVPLNLYLQSADEADARSAALDYGQAIKDLAVTNIFPGDLFLKNFGVTRQRRVVFYDYDEVCRLTDCNFRVLPQGDCYDEEVAAEPWFAVAKNDVFPQEFPYFIGIPAPFRDEFEQRHGELYDVPYWHGLQQKLNTGALFHVAPFTCRAGHCLAQTPAS